MDMDIFETSLPGVGVRYEFDTEDGRKLGVLVRRDGRRELLIYSVDDSDSCSAAIDMSQTESAALVELLGGTKITERIHEVRHEVEGLAVEWITLNDNAPLVGRTIGEGQIRTRTGASVVAVLRGHESFPGPGPEFQFHKGDVVLMTGSDESVDRARLIIAG